jgi:predicted AlkP superfamily phosphohydrolase/phosphomutase
MRVLVFGVDGLTFRVLHPMFQAGHLPHFQALEREGFSAILESKYPPLTPPAWMSLTTGLKPAQHGVYDFWEYNEQSEGRLVTRRKAGKAIWNLLSEYGKRVIVVNVPLTYPPEPVNGIMLSGIQGTNERGNFTYPAAFREELLAHVPGYRIDVDVTSVIQGRLTPAQAAVQLIEQRIKAMQYLLTQKHWDFAFITFCAADYLQHLCWENILAMQPDVLRYYQLLDEALGLARTTLGAEGTLFVVSDHGFQGAHTRFALNEYLLRQRWFTHRPGMHYYRTLLDGLGKYALNTVGLLEHGRAVKLRISHKKGQSFTKVKPYLTRQKQQRAGVSVASWSCSSGGYADLCISHPLSRQQMADLRGALLTLTDPVNGHRLIESIYDTEVFGQGAFQPTEAHLLLLPTEGYTFSPTIGQPWLWNRERHLYGTHQKDGVLYACGPGITAGVQGKPTEIYDLVSTILHTMELPRPTTLEGRVIAEMFGQRESVVEHEVSRSIVDSKLKMLQGR